MTGGSAPADAEGRRVGDNPQRLIENKHAGADKEKEKEKKKQIHDFCFVFAKKICRGAKRRQESQNSRRRGIKSPGKRTYRLFFSFFAFSTYSPFFSFYFPFFPLSSLLLTPSYFYLCSVFFLHPFFLLPCLTYLFVLSPFLFCLFCLCPPPFSSLFLFRPFCPLPSYWPPSLVLFRAHPSVLLPSSSYLICPFLPNYVRELKVPLRTSPPQLRFFAAKYTRSDAVNWPSLRRFSRLNARQARFK